MPLCAGSPAPFWSMTAGVEAPRRGRAGLEARVAEQFCAAVQPPPRPELIVQVKLAEPDAPVVSLAVTVTLKVPAAVGVPEIRPVEELIDRPASAGRSRCR